MGDLVDINKYRKAKPLSLSERAEQLHQELTEGLEHHYLELNDEVGLESYRYVLITDLARRVVRSCYHDNWSVVEDGYVAKCDKCKLNAWSDTW
jgi:hypothetical protein